jgi:hypothetical protein
MMAKLHRKAADGRPMTGSSSERQPVRAAAEAVTALDEWDAEGGASGKGRADGGDASARPLLERLLLERLGVALVGEWSKLPARLQRVVYERAVSVGLPSQRPTIRRQMARFLHEQGNRARRPLPREAAPTDSARTIERSSERDSAGPRTGRRS